MSYIDTIRAARDKPAELAALIEAVGRVLYKFTEGKEDWTEYQALYEALCPFVIDESLPPDVVDRLVMRLDDYEERLYGLY